MNSVPSDQPVHRGSAATAERCECGHSSGSHSAGKGKCRQIARCGCDAYRATSAPAVGLPSDDGVEYRDVCGFPGYVVGSDGSVWSRRTNGGRLGGEWRRVKFKVGHRDYPRAHLCIGRQRRAKPVSHLVLEAFVGPRPDGTEACHFPDANPLNNRVENLRWDTHIANVGDKQIHGTTARGTAHGSAKLTEAQVVEMRHLYRTERPSYAALGRRFGVSGHQAKLIVLRINWSHLPSDGE